MKRHTAIGLLAAMLAATLLAGSCRGASGEDRRGRAAPRQVREFTGARTRAVWCQDVGEGTDLLARGDQFRLMGFDTDDGLGVRAILPQVSNYSRPMITPKGDRIVFSNRKEHKIYVVHWDGSGFRPLMDGHGLDVWRDPADGVEWLYYAADAVDVPSQTDRAYSGVRRCRLDDPSASEPVWDRTVFMQVSENNFQLSADGTRASLWAPELLGVAGLPNAGWQGYGKGCWPSLAPDDSYAFWHFDGGHRSVTAYDPGGGNPRRIIINTAPGMDGFEVFHPRWANHARYFAVSGPLEIAGGGPEVEVHIGRVDGRVTAIEGWARVTHNDRADFFPDIWIEGGEKATLDYPQRPAEVAAASPAAAPPSGPRPKAVVEARLIETSRIPMPATIAPYRRALVANRYEVVSVVEGECPHQEIMAAHWAIRDAQVLVTGPRQAGSVYRMTIELYDGVPGLQSERLLMDGDQFALPLYYDADSQGE